LRLLKKSLMKLMQITMTSRTDTMMPNGEFKRPTTTKSGLVLMKSTETLRNKRDRSMREDRPLKMQSIPWHQPLTISSKSMMMLSKQERTKLNSSKMKLTLMLETTT
jgi:hypothetical protein